MNGSWPIAHENKVVRIVNIRRTELLDVGRPFLDDMMPCVTLGSMSNFVLEF